MHCIIVVGITIFHGIFRALLLSNVDTEDRSTISYCIISILFVMEAYLRHVYTKPVEICTSKMQHAASSLTCLVFVLDINAYTAISSIII